MDLNTADDGARDEQGESTTDVPVASTSDLASDPAWRLLALTLPAGAGLSAVLALGQALSGSLGPAVGYPAAFTLALLCAGSLYDARRRAATGRWVRTEVSEFFLPLVLPLVALFLLARGAEFITCAPALLTLLPTAWQIAHVPRVERVTKMLPRALPMLDESVASASATDDADGIRPIIRDVLDRLPADIASRLEGWTVEVREEAAEQPPNTIIFGQCFYGTHAIAIYRRPHLRYGGHGDAFRRAVTYTLLHEIAHALGLDETGVRRLGWLTDAAT